MVTTRPQRADARRNRDRLLAEAATAYSERGVDVPLEEIARRSDVGIGTLYRHFPTRDALIEAVYRREVELLCESAEDLRRDLPPEQALERWLERFIDYVAAKRGMAEALKSIVGADSMLFAESRQRFEDAVAGLVGAAVDVGAVRGDIAPMDLLRAVSGICTASQPLALDWRDYALRLVGLLMDGMRYPVS